MWCLNAGTWLLLIRNFFATDSISDRFGEVLILGIIILLFYRFTFGLPSRRYYGVAIIPGTAIQEPDEGQ